MQSVRSSTIFLTAVLASTAPAAQSTAPQLPPAPAGVPDLAVEPECRPAPYGTRCAEAGAQMERLGLPIFPGFDDDGFPLVYPGTRVAANGGSLRNCASTGINLVGVPMGSVVVQAFLYWAWTSLPGPIPGLHDTMQIARMPLAPMAGPPGAALPVRCRARTVTGVLVGAGPDPCWLGFGNFVYRADVTALVTRGGSYMVWVPPGASGAVDWSDPWGFPGPLGPLCEGASLVVVYTNPFEPPGTTYIYDGGLAGMMFLSTPGLAYTLMGFAYPGLAARWIHVGADGQTGAGYADVLDLGIETTFVGPLSIAGGGFGIAPPSLYNDSDWNGSANKPLGQLWDTSGHDISAAMPPGAAAIGLFHVGPAGGPISDCLVPVCDVLWMM